MEKGQSPSKANKGMHRFITGRPWAVLVVPILLSMLIFNNLKKRKKSAEKESIEGASTAEKERIEGASTAKKESIEGATKESIEEASTSFISSIATRVSSHRYGIFLSFRGLDTHKGFVDQLHHRLDDAETVLTWVSTDDNNVPIGENFDSQILDAIAQSKILIPIISNNYASSKWCLRELIHIMDCNKSMSHKVWPIFYKVDPSDVRYFKGSFGESFHLHKKPFDEKDIQEWQQALTEVSDLPGCQSEKVANGHEGELMELVVKTILSELRKDFQLNVPNQLVGLDGCVKDIMNWIDSPSANARMIEIYGMGGIGKTTLAKTIYNKLMNDFKHCCFLPNIRETVRNYGITHLQNQLIKELQPNERVVHDVDEGVALIKSTLKRKKVLILLDDVDVYDFLAYLVGPHDWFMAGSIIIVTTRNQDPCGYLKFEAYYKYEMKDLDKADSLLLFNRCVFLTDHSWRDYEDISRDIVSTTGGLPLAIEIIGSSLYGVTNREVWQHMLWKLKEEPSEDVQKTLRISYDYLEEEEKVLFLDIACFLIGKRMKFAMYMWADCQLYPRVGIEQLTLKSLLKVKDDKLRMHDQLRDFARSIICKGQLPENRSRLWDYEETSRMLKEKRGTRAIEAISLDKYYDDLQAYTNEHFENLQSLRFLKLRWAALSGEFNGLFSELRWLQWLDIEPNLSFSATNLHLSSLVVLQLSHNRITEHWKGWSSIMVAKRLKVLDLAFCNNLRCTPDLSPFKSLEILILANCSKLEKVHPSIGEVKCLISLDLRNCYHLKELPKEVGEIAQLSELILDHTCVTEIPMSIGIKNKLQILSAGDCSSLRTIPSSIGSLSYLEHLNLQGCESLREIPSSIGNLFSLIHLDLRCCQLREIPSSIGDLKNLKHLDISQSLIEELPMAIGTLLKLERLFLKFCRNLKGEIPIHYLSSLQILEITRAKISYLPKSIKGLISLQRLSLWGCSEIWSMPEFPSGLQYLTVSCQSPKLPQLCCLVHLEEVVLFKCHHLEDLPELPSRLSKLCVDSCPKLMLPKLDGFTDLKELSVQNCSSIERLDFSQLNRLKRLLVGLCYKLVELQGRDNLKFLEEIVIDRCRSIERLILPEAQSLNQIKVNSCDNLVQIQGLDRAEFLQALDISDCGSIEILPDLSCFATLRELNITRCNSLEKLQNLSRFEKLENFTMRYSLGIMEIPGVEELKSLTHIDITGCKSMATLPDLSRCDKLQSLVIRDCNKLSRLQGLEKLDLNYLDIFGCASLETIPKLPETCIVRNHEKER